MTILYHFYFWQFGPKIWQTSTYISQAPALHPVMGPGAIASQAGVPACDDAKCPQGMFIACL